MTAEQQPRRLMRIEAPQDCRIIERLNRFVVVIEVNGIAHRAHLTNTGRLAEFLVRGRKAFCFRTHHGGATDYRLFAIEERGLGAVIDTWLQMEAFEAAVKQQLIPCLKGCQLRSKNAPLGASRIDYLLACRGGAWYLEVKSAVLRDGAYALYPDCPSERGRKHIRELTAHVRTGGSGALVFMAALPGVRAFKANRAADPALYELLREAYATGVDLRALGLYYHPEDGWVYLYADDLTVDLL
jgi:sugar fermentation stimulation protein A